MIEWVYGSAPSRLKNILAECENASQMYRALKRQKMLKSRGWFAKRELISHIERWLQPDSVTGKPIPGPSSLDRLANSLVPFLNDQGIDAYHGAP